MGGDRQVSAANQGSLQRTPQGGKQRAQGTRNPTAIKHDHRIGLVHVIDDPPAIPLQHETEQDEVGVVQVIDVVAVSQTVDEQPRQAEQERSEEHTSELQSLMRNSYAVFCLKKKKNRKQIHES